MRWTRPYWQKYKGLCMASIVCVSMEALCDLLQPQVMSRLIDNGVAQLDIGYVIRMGLLMLGITALGACFACARNIFSSRASQRFGADLRRDLFVKIQRISIADAEQFDGGSLVTRLTNDVTHITNFVNGIMRISFKAPVVCMGSVLMAAVLNVRTIPIVIGIVAAALAFISLSMRLSYPEFARVQVALDKLNTTVREYLMGVRLVRAFNRYAFEKKRFATANSSLSDTTCHANRLLGFFSPLTGLATNTGIVLILWIGSRWVGAGNMHVGQIVAFVSYMTQIFFSLNMINFLLNMLVRTKASYARVNEVMTITDSDSIDDETIIAKQERMSLGMSVSFEDVTFRYPLATGESALQSIHFSLEPGQMLGVIGPTGSGKSTFAALLLRFYEPTQGVIRVCGEDLLRIPMEKLRSLVAVVPQTPALFTGTIKENLRWGDEFATDESLREAACCAQSEAFILASPNGYDTELGQHGVNLSGGQKQRISIARAMVRNPNLLILDDCTSALDALTESQVLTALRERTRDMTCILISQRVGTVRRADRILVLEDGKQAGFGTHAELLESCDMYRDIYESQVGVTRHAAT